MAFGSVIGQRVLLGAYTESTVGLGPDCLWHV